MKITIAVILLLDVAFLISGTEAKSSPCPQVFSYDEQEDTADTWYGTLRLKTSVALHGIFIDVIFDGQVFVFGAYFKDVTTKDNLHFHIEDKAYRLNGGETLILKFYVKHPEFGEVPMLRQVRFNGQNICVDVSNRQYHSETPEITRSFEKPTTQQENISHQDAPIGRGNSHSFHSVQPISSSGFQQGTPATSSIISTTSRTTLNTITASQNVKTFTNAPVVGSRFSPSTPLIPAIENNRKPIVSGHSTKLYDPITDPTIWKKPAGGTTARPIRQPDPSYIGSDNDKLNSRNSNPINRKPDEQESHTQYGDTHKSGSFLTGRISSDHSGDRKDSVLGSGTESAGFFQSDYRQQQQEQTTTTKKPSYFQGDYAFIQHVETTTHYINSFDQDICGTIVPKANPLVTHGASAQATQFPWHGALYRSTVTELKYLCGATIISNRIAITAAHCVAHDKSSNAIDPGSLLLYLGKTNLKKWTGPEQDAKVDQIHIHPNYDYRRFFADIAVLKLRSDVKFNHFIRPACLWNFDEDYKVLINKVGFVPGWGYNEQGLVSEELSFAQMPVVAHETCIWSNRDFFSKVTSNTSYCAGFRNGTSVCNGDSGGGMVFKQNNHWYLRGIVSVSAALQNNISCDTNHYAVFTDVAKFLQWIQSFM